jgi:DNA primase catalytic subunit
MSRAQEIAKSYYARKDIQQAILEFCKNREVVPNFNQEFFGKRPDMLDYPNDIFNWARQGATSFHCSEELWREPLKISTEMTPEQLNEIRIGWDFLIDIDSKYLDYSKIAAKLIIKALEYNGVKNIGIKFSGSKGFHIIVPSKAFPKEINKEQTKDKFPEWARLIASYIKEMIHDKLTQEVLKLQADSEKLVEIIYKPTGETAKTQKMITYKCPNCKTEAGVISETEKKQIKCNVCRYNMEKTAEDKIYIAISNKDNSQKNPDLFVKKYTAKSLIDSIDIVLVAPRHLFRTPYSLHEKTALASCVIENHEIEDFQPKDADPLKIKLKNFLPDSEEGEASELLIHALDWAKKEEKKPKKFSGKSINIKNLTIKEDIFPDCIKKILNGIKRDGRKRALFILLSFFTSLEFPQEYIEEKIEKWNTKNYKPLKKGYIKSQLDWFSRNKIMPPNCNSHYYKELQIPCSCDNVKNPINYTIKQALKSKKPKKNESKK